MRIAHLATSRKRRVWVPETTVQRYTKIRKFNVTAVNKRESHNSSTYATWLKAKGSEATWSVANPLNRSGQDKGDKLDDNCGDLTSIIGTFWSQHNTKPQELKHVGVALEARNSAVECSRLFPIEHCVQHGVLGYGGGVGLFERVTHLSQCCSIPQQRTQL